MSFGTMAVDFEERINFSRLRNERLQKAKQSIKDYGLGAVLCYDSNNIRYITGAHAPLWTGIDKMTRYCILPRNAEPLLYDVGSLAQVRMLPHGATWLKGRTPSGSDHRNR